MNDTTKICITVFLSVAVIFAGILGTIKLVNEQRHEAGLTRCLITGMSYPQWVNEKNCAN